MASDSTAWPVLTGLADAALTWLRAARVRVRELAWAQLAETRQGLPTSTAACTGLSLGIAGPVAVILRMGQIVRTATTHDGDALALGVLGIGKATVAFMLILSVTGTALVNADELSAFIIERTFGSADGLQHELINVLNWVPQTTPSPLLIMAIVGILLVTVLWFEPFLRNAAVAALIATSPISAIGTLSQSTREWWPKVTASTIWLVVFKSTIAHTLAFAVTGSSQSEDLGTFITAYTCSKARSGDRPCLHSSYAISEMTSTFR